MRRVDDQNITMNKQVALTIIAVTLLGLAVGAGVAAVRMAFVPWEGKVSLRRNPPSSDVGQGAPKVVVDQIDYDFGSMDADDQQSHDFLLTNAGSANLVISAGDTSCKCVLSEIKQLEVPPGGVTKISVTWTAGKHVGEFRQVAKVKTNDPDKRLLELTVSGRIRVAVLAVPEQLEFPRLAVGETASGQVMLYCSLDGPLEIDSLKLSDQDTAGYFDVSLEPLEPDQLGDQPDAKSGYLLRVTVKSGLPLGPFKQTILIETNLADYPAIVVPIMGTLVGDISVVGRGWNHEAGVLDLGTVKSSRGLKRRLQLIVRGPHRQNMKFTLGQVTPDDLKISFGDTKPIGEGAAWQTPLFIEVPEGAKPGAYLGSQQHKLGRITIETNHPTAPRLNIPVKLAIESE
jgi:hypothetical protein